MDRDGRSRLLDSRVPAGVFLTTIGLLAVVMPKHQQSGQPDLTGRWEIQKPPSATPVDTGTVAATPTPRTPTQRERDSARDEIAKLRARLNVVLGMAGEVPAFAVRQDDSSIVITNEDGFTYTLYPDGRKAKISIADTIDVEYRARWKNRELVVEWKPETGGKMVETYSLAVNDRFLRLDVTADSDGLARPVWRSRLYRRAEAQKSDTTTR